MVSGCGRSMSGNESTLYACQTVISDAHANAAQIAGWLIELTALLNNTAADPPPRAHTITCSAHAFCIVPA